MTRESEKKMWGNMLILLFGNPSKETIDGLSEVINGECDIETSIDMIDDLVKNDKSLSPLRHTKEDVEIGYKTGYQEAIKRTLEVIDRTIDEDDKSPVSWTAACKAIKREVLALMGEEE